MGKYTMVNLTNDDGNELPIRCTLDILEKIQGEFGDIMTFSSKLIPSKRNRDGKEVMTGEMPDIHAIVYALPLFVNEGIDEYNTEHINKLDRMTPKTIFTMCEKPVIEVALILYTELWRSINAPKQQPPTDTTLKEE